MTDRRPDAVVLPPPPTQADLVPFTPSDYGFSRMAPRIWHGMTLPAWLRLMRGNWGQVDPARYGLVASVTALSITNAGFAGLSRAIYGRRLAQVEISPDPLFVLGHWRSGTTWLNTIFDNDFRLAGTSSLQCFQPESFLLAQKLLMPLLRPIINRKRPMDNVEISTDAAQEDEVALLLSGAKSSYRSIAFPRNLNQIEALTVEDLDPADAAHWRRSWLGFLRAVQYVNPGRRLVLKSPTHTLRIPEILRHFPNAKFVHIVRDPYRIVGSHSKTMLAMPATQGFQSSGPGVAYQQKRVLRDFMPFHQRLWDTEGQIPKGNYVCVRYEDLRANGRAEIGRIYETLGLGDFGEVESRIGDFLDTQKGYQTNAFEMPDALEAEIWTQWRPYFERYGYARMGDREPAEG